MDVISMYEWMNEWMNEWMMVLNNSWLRPHLTVCISSDHRCPIWCPPPPPHTHTLPFDMNFDTHLFTFLKWVLSKCCTQVCFQPVLASAAMEILSREAEFETFRKVCGELCSPGFSCISLWSGVEFNSLLYVPMTWRDVTPFSYVKPLQIRGLEENANHGLHVVCWPWWDV
jgi:hypothetical protein